MMFVTPPSSCVISVRHLLLRHHGASCSFGLTRSTSTSVLICEDVFSGSARRCQESEPNTSESHRWTLMSHWTNAFLSHQIHEIRPVLRGQSHLQLIRSHGSMCLINSVIAHRWSIHSFTVIIDRALFTFSLWLCVCVCPCHDPRHTHTSSARARMTHAL